MAETYAELRKLTDEDLIDRHDKAASTTAVGTGHYLQELHRRDQDRLSETMRKYTRWITIMTVVIMIATIGNVILTVLIYTKEP